MIIFNTQDPDRKRLQSLSRWSTLYAMEANHFRVKVTHQDDSTHEYSFNATGTLEKVSKGIIALNPDAKKIELEGGHIVYDEDGDQVF